MATIDQVAAAALSVGLSEKDAALATAIAGAETGGTFDERTVGDGGRSRGVWQINSCEAPGQPSPAWPNLCSLAKGDLKAQAVAMNHVRVNGRRGWGEWSVYKSGMGPYLRYHNAAVQAVARQVGKDPSRAFVSGVPGVGGLGESPVSLAMTDTVNKIGQLIEGVASGSLLKRGLMIVAGLLVVALAAGALIEDLSGVNPVGKAVGAVPVVRGAKAMRKIKMVT